MRYREKSCRGFQREEIQGDGMKRDEIQRDEKATHSEKQMRDQPARTALDCPTSLPAAPTLEVWL